MRRPWGLLALITLAGTALAAPPLLNSQGQPHPDWHFVGLPGQKRPATRFIPEQVEQHVGLRLEADDSYGNWVHVYPGPTPVRHLRWAWRVDVANDRTDLRHRHGDDVAARICVSFDMPLSRLTFLERQKLALARKLSGLDVAAATLCYVWGASEARGSVVDNVFTRRVRQIVLRNHDDASRTWYEENRDVVADFLLAFGDEASQAYPATALIIGADSDNTHRHTVAHVADVQAAP